MSVQAPLKPPSRLSETVVKRFSSEQMSPRPRRWKPWCGTTVETFGGLRCAFNNSGILPPTAPLAQMEEADFDKVIAVDLMGVFLCMKYEIRHMLHAGGGAIVNTASVAGVVANPGMSPYVAAKHGVIGLSRAAAIDYAARAFA